MSLVEIRNFLNLDTGLDVMTPSCFQLELTAKSGSHSVRDLAGPQSLLIGSPPTSDSKIRQFEKLSLR